MTKQAVVQWSRHEKCWVIRYWSESEQEWNEDSRYPVKEINPETEIGWVSELLITRLYDLQDLGYQVVFA